LIFVIIPRLIENLHLLHCVGADQPAERVGNEDQRHIAQQRLPIKGELHRLESGKMEDHRTNGSYYRFYEHLNHQVQRCIELLGKGTGAGNIDTKHNARRGTENVAQKHILAPLPCPTGEANAAAQAQNRAKDCQHTGLLFDKEEHQVVTGVTNEIVLENAAFLAEKQKLYEVRAVIVPDLYDAKKSVRAMGEYLKPYLKIKPFRIKLIAYRPMGVREEYSHYRVPDQAYLEELREMLETMGYEEIIII